MKKKKPEDRIMPAYVKPKQNERRPPEITLEIIQAIVNAIKFGNYFETACAVAGFHKATGYTWLKRGANEPGTLYAQFNDAVRKAEADAEARDVALIDISAHGSKAQFDAMGNMVRKEVERDVKVAMWRLERKYPKHWSRTEKLEHTGKEGGPMTFTDFIKKLGEGEEEE